uniref:Reverse transcriptase domain-containing protein n=1 Tax=Tanacetum cinerariifolium TaxID=118510 RepID=A0A6L2L1U3_TANCI|nr:reverse transcriptase domain-containing protein [Tanacetum cinerariifolium]
MCPHIQEAQSGSHTTVVAGTQKAATKVLALKNRNCFRETSSQKRVFTKNESSVRKCRLEVKTKEAKVDYGGRHVPTMEKMHQISGRNPQHQAKNEESMEEFVKRYKLEYRDVKGASECMKIFGFMHGIINPELIKRLHDKIPKSMDEMMSETRQKQNFKRGNFQNEQRMERKQDRFTLLTKTPREILALDKGKFKPPPSMTNPVEKKNASKFCEFHGEVGRTIDEYQAKIAKKGETSRKDKSLAILMVQPWQRIARQRITQTFSPKSVISFPTIGEEDGTKGPMIIEAVMGGHCVYRIYVDGGSSSEILYEHCFSKFRSKIKNQLIPANTPLVGFSREIIWPLGQISLLVRIGDEEHSTSTLMNFMVVRSPSPYNKIIGRPGQKKRGQAPERNKAISEEVKKLVEANIMKEVHHHSWLSNPVTVKKHDDSWRMCVDFKDLNKACPEDGYPLPERKKSLPFFKTLKKYTKKSDFQWTPEAEGAFKEMKQSIVELPMLTAPKEKKELIMYLAAAKEAISAILMTERDGKQMKDKEELPDPCILFTDGSSCIDGSGAGLIITNPEGMEFTYALRFRFNATNNEAEYEALTAGLRIARQIGVQNLQANVDSKLVANQVNGIYIANESSMIRGENKKADTLSKITSTSFAHMSKQVLVEELREKEIDEKEILVVVEEGGHTWMTPVYEYLTEGILPEKKKKVRTVQRKARRYVMINEVLHKKSFLGLWLWCVGPLQENYVLREIHEGHVACMLDQDPRWQKL